MKRRNEPLQILKAYGGSVFGAFGFVLSFCFFFYLARVLFIPGYRLETGFLLANTAFLGGLLLAFLLLPGPAWLYLIPAYFAFLLPTLLVSLYIVLYRTPFNFNTFYFVWETNGAEASDFFSDSLKRFPLLPLWVLGCAGLPLLTVRTLCRALAEVRRQGWLLRIGLFAAGLIFVFWGGYLFGARRYNYVTKTYDSALNFALDKKFVRVRAALAPWFLADTDVRPVLPEGEKETCVLVIGESADRHHWQAYGYPRPTTPLISARVASGGVLCFRNVCATLIGTTGSLYHALTFIEQDETTADYTYSFIDVFNRAGFKTFWLTNNAVLGVYDTLLEAFTKNSSVWRATTPKDADVQAMQPNMMNEGEVNRYYGEVTYDGYLLPWFDEALADPAPKKMIVLHLKGSHGTYAYRYPKAFDRFRTEEGITSPFLEEIPQLVPIVNAYDNSILYTDWILDQVIRRLEAFGGRSFMLHFSDHGDEAFDYYPFYLRNIDFVDKYALDVPFLAWFSETYRKERNISAFKEGLDRPAVLDDALYALMDLAELRTPLQKPERSVFSPAWKMRPRFVMRKPYLDYPPHDLFNEATAAEERRLLQKVLSGDAAPKAEAASGDRK